MFTILLFVVYTGVVCVTWGTVKSDHISALSFAFYNMEGSYSGTLRWKQAECYLHLSRLCLNSAISRNICICLCNWLYIFIEFER